MIESDIKYGIEIICNKTHTSKKETILNGTRFIVEVNNLVLFNGMLRIFVYCDLGNGRKKLFEINQKKLKYYDTKAGRIRRIAKEHIG